MGLMKEEAGYGGAVSNLTMVFLMIQGTRALHFKKISEVSMVPFDRMSLLDDLESNMSIGSTRR